MKMNNQEIQRALRRAIAQETPDVFEQVSSSSPVLTTREEAQMQTTTLAAPRKKPAIRAALIAACLLLAAVLSLSGYAYSTQETSWISLDVNPSLEIVTNRKDRVLRVEPRNADGEAILEGMDLKGADLDVAMNAILGSMVKQGYLTDVKNAILVTVESRNGQKAQELRTRLDEDISQSLTDTGITPTVIQQSGDAGLREQVEREAQEKGVSYGKALMLHRLEEQFPELRGQGLETMSVTQIADLVTKHGLDLDRVLDDDGPYCDDCGRLEADCDRLGNCPHDGRYCEWCGQKVGTCQHTDWERLSEELEEELENRQDPYDDLDDKEDPDDHDDRYDDHDDDPDDRDDRDDFDDHDDWDDDPDDD